jgi:hypothetical protein
MDSKIWGPYFWFTLHTITLVFPDQPTYQDKRHYHDFFLSLQNVLPCLKCREHYKQHLQEFPVSSHLDNKESLVKWCFILHNKVNQSLGKEEFTYDEFKDKYKKIYSPTILQKVINNENIKKYKKYKIFSLLILLSVVLLFIFRFYKKIGGKRYFFK